MSEYLLVERAHPLYFIGGQRDVAVACFFEDQRKFHEFPAQIPETLANLRKIVAGVHGGEPFDSVQIK